jgi:hypothetical protein
MQTFKFGMHQTDKALPVIYGYVLYNPGGYNILCRAFILERM